MKAPLTLVQRLKARLRVGEITLEQAAAELLASSPESARRTLLDAKDFLRAKSGRT